MADNMDLAHKSDDESASVVVVTPAEPASEKGEGEAAETGKSPQQHARLPGIGADVAQGGDEAEEPKKKQVVGIVPQSKDLYAKYDQHKNRSWTEKKPDDFEEAAENEDTEKYAVIVRKGKSSAPVPTRRR